MDITGDIGEDYVRGFDARDLGAGSETRLSGHLYRQRVRAVVNAANRFGPPARVVDMGCAQGNIAIALAKRGFEVIGIDQYASFLNVARQKDGSEKVEWVQANLQEYVSSDQFDIGVLAEVIEHTGTPEQLIDRCASLIRPGGHLILTTPNASRLRQRLPTFTIWRADREAAPGWIQFGPAGEHHVYLFKESELRALLGPHFVDVQISGVSTIYWNDRTAWLLRHPSLRGAIDALERLSLQAPMGRGWLANQLVLTARRTASKVK